MVEKNKRGALSQGAAVKVNTHVSHHTLYVTILPRVSRRVRFCQVE